MMQELPPTVTVVAAEDAAKFRPDTVTMLPPTGGQSAVRLPLVTAHPDTEITMGAVGYWY